MCMDVPEGETCPQCGTVHWTWRKGVRIIGGWLLALAVAGGLILLIRHQHLNSQYGSW